MKMKTVSLSVRRLVAPSRGQGDRAVGSREADERTSQREQQSRQLQGQRRAQSLCTGCRRQAEPACLRGRGARSVEGPAAEPAPASSEPLAPAQPAPGPESSRSDPPAEASPQGAGGAPPALERNPPEGMEDTSGGCRREEPPGEGVPEGTAQG
ncbi:unnamed protein product, partial [Boreogadus saida]